MRPDEKRSLSIYLSIYLSICCLLLNPAKAFSATQITHTSKTDWQSGLLVNATWYPETQLQLDWEGSATGAIAPSTHPWLSGWSYRRLITINNSLAYGLSDYQVFIPTSAFGSAWPTIRSRAKSNMDDFRFTPSTSSVTLPYWIDDNTTTPKGFWVKVSTLTAGYNEVCMYYGNSSTGAPTIKIGDAGLPGWNAYMIKKVRGGAATDRVYWIDPDGGNTSNAYQVYSDMTTDGGGWILIAKVQDDYDWTNTGNYGNLFHSNLESNLVDSSLQTGALSAQHMPNSKIRGLWTLSQINDLRFVFYDTWGTISDDGYARFNNNYGLFDDTVIARYDKDTHYSFNIITHTKSDKTFTGLCIGWGNQNGQTYRSYEHGLFMGTPNGDGLAGTHMLNDTNIVQVKSHYADNNGTQWYAGAHALVQTAQLQVPYNYITFWIRQYAPTSPSPNPELTVSANPEQGLYQSSATYSSPVIDATSKIVVSSISWNPSTQPTGTNLTVSIRASKESFAADSPTPAWHQVSNNSNPGIVGRYVQYSSTFTTSVTTSTPRLEDIAITYKPAKPWKEKSVVRTGSSSHGFYGGDDWTWQVPVKGGQLVTISAYIRYNTDYQGASYDKPKLTLSGLGINESISATSSAENSWELRQLSGTPISDGILTLKAEGFSTNLGGKFYIDDVNISQ